MQQEQEFRIHTSPLEETLRRETAKDTTALDTEGMFQNHPEGLKLCRTISVALLLDGPAPLLDPVCWCSHVTSSFAPVLGLPFLGRCPPLSEGSVGVWQRPALPKALKSCPASSTAFVFIFFCLSWLLEWLRLSAGLRVQEIRGPLSLSLIQASISHSMLMSVTGPKRYCHDGLTTRALQPSFKVQFGPLLAIFSCPVSFTFQCSCL